MIPTFTIEATGAKVPAIAFGSGSKHRIKKWEDPTLDDSTLDEGLVNIIEDAIKAGFRHLDTAECYTTQGEMCKAITNSGLDRSEFWISDKSDSGWPEKQIKARSRSGPLESCEKGLKLFNIDYYDQYLLHSPFYEKEYSDCTVEDAWKQMEQLYFEGKCKTIGVCNFTVPDLERINRIAKVKPQINQIEHHLYLQNQSSGIVEYCQKNGILVEAFAPLTPILNSKVGIKDHPLSSIISKLSEKYNVSPSSICLRWVYQNGVLPVTTSSNYDRMKQAFEIFTFELSKEDFDLLKDVGSTHKVLTMFKKYYENR